MREGMISLRSVSPRRLRRTGIALSGALLLAGCAGIPGAERAAPLAGAPPSALSLPAGTAQWPDENWWRGGDPQLAGLIEEGLAHSPDLAATAARMRKAAAMARIAGAAQLPSLDTRGGLGLERQSLNIGFPPAFAAFLPHGWDDNGQVAATLGFDPDLWGRNRSAATAARAEAAASAIEASTARLALATAIAGAYADLSGLLAVAEVRRAEVDNRSALLRLVSERAAAGLEYQATVRTAEAQLASARGDLAAARAGADLRRHQLGALLGAGPDRVANLVPAPTELAAALPADAATGLLARRGDIAAARLRVEAAAARIRVARADFFPSLRLDALIGFQSIGIDKLLQPASTFGSIGPALNLPLFHGGARIGQYRGAQADFEVARADYERTVLAAYQQAADAVTNRAALLVQRSEARTAESASAEAFHIAQERYRAGLSSYLDVLTVEERWLQARLAAASLDAAARGADVALIRALGGGYTAAGAEGHR
jgi:NodT family efflux transporter outer membrane factor (OMF) lipoprotein